jgi:hypothetical protein
MRWCGGVTTSDYIEPVIIGDGKISTCGSIIANVPPSAVRLARSKREPTGWESGEDGSDPRARWERLSGEASA